MSKPLYIAGPMTGIAQFNFPAFEAAACQLRAAGFEVISPHEKDSPAVQAAAWASPDGNLRDLESSTSETWGDMLARDVKLIADECSGVVLLRGWHKSRGARLEAFVALLAGHPIYLYDELPPGGDFLSPAPQDYVRASLLA